MAYLHRLIWLVVGLALGGLSVSAFAQQSPSITYGACGFKGYGSPGGACSAAASALCGQYSKWCQGGSLTSNGTYCSPTAGGRGCTITMDSVCPLGYNKIGGLCYPSSGGGTTQPPPSGSTCTAGEVNSNPGGTLKETTSYCAPVSETTSCSTTVDWYTQPDGSVAGHIKRTGTTCTEEPPTGECTPQSSNFLGYLDDQPFCGPSSGTNPDADPDPDPDPDPTPDPGTDPGGGPGPGGTVSPGTGTGTPSTDPCQGRVGCKPAIVGEGGALGCPDGYILNSTTGACYFAGSVGCPDGYQYSYFEHKCVPVAPAPTDPDAPPGEPQPGPGEVGSGSFGGSCGEVDSFTCEGDAVACATALAVARTECALKTSAGVVSQYEAMAAFDGTGEGEGLDKKIIDVEGMLNPSVQGGGSGLQDLTVDVLGQPITIPFSKLNLYLQMIGYAVMAIAWLSAFKIIAGAF